MCVCASIDHRGLFSSQGLLTSVIMTEHLCTQSPRGNVGLQKTETLWVYCHITCTWKCILCTLSIFLDAWMTYNIWYRNIPQCNVVNLTFLFKCEQRTRNDNLEINHFLCSSGSNYNKLRHFCIRLKIIFNSKFNKHVMVMWQIDLLHTTV